MFKTVTANTPEETWITTISRRRVSEETRGVCPCRRLPADEWAAERKYTNRNIAHNALGSRGASGRSGSSRICETLRNLVESSRNPVEA